MKENKLYVIRKVLMAKDVKDALRKDSKTPVSEIFIDDDWAKATKERAPENGQISGFGKI